MAPLLFQTYNEEPKFSVAGYLTAYLKRTKNYEDTDKLFLACIKPYREASKDIISRWCKSIIKESGIKIHNYPSHSSRTAASFYAKSRGDCSAGWKLEMIFKQFYDKIIEEEFEFQNHLLQDN